MAEHRDRVADALAAMASGQGGDEADHDAHAAPQPAQPAQLPPPAPGRPGRPTAPGAAAPPPDYAAAPPDYAAAPEAIEVPPDDDAMLAPAPPVSMLGHSPPPQRRVPIRQSPEKSLHYKQTVIPVFLTLGVTLPLMAAFGYAVSADSPFAAFRGGVAAGLVGLGLLMLGFGIGTMLQVRSELQKLAGPAPLHEPGAGPSTPAAPPGLARPAGPPSLRPRAPGSGGAGR